MKALEKEIKVVATNRKATFQYFIVNRYKAGIVLGGTEVKSVRSGKVNLSDAYCIFKDGELWMRSVHIAEYRHGGFYNHAAKRERKLLLTKRELRKLETRIKERGYTIIPTEIFINERNFIKVEIALVKGKKAFNKKNSIRERDIKRDMDRSLKGY